jgi:hypothetical protein
MIVWGMAHEKNAYRDMDIVEVTGSIETAEPLTIRLPRTGQRCPWTGLSRSAMNELILPCKGNDFSPPVRSKVLLAQGKSRGIRLVIFASLKEYLLREPLNKAFSDPS